MVVTLNRQRGVTLYETVLTIMLIGIISVALSVSLFKPIQDIFWLNEQMSYQKPSLIALEDLRINLKGPVSQLSADDQTLSLITPSGKMTYRCEGEQMLKNVENEEIGVQLTQVHCGFEAKEVNGGWVVKAYVVPLDGSQESIHRLYFVSQGGIYATP